MYSYSTIKLIELEISTYCNAACPQCPRNNYGGLTIDDLPLINWTLDQLKTILEPSFIQQLKMVYFCGTYGDPLMNPNLVEMCRWLKEVNPKLDIGIHTNGGVGSEKTFTDLAKMVKFIAFGIDGLEDTNHIYRKNTKWKKIISNCESFIKAGGYAIWDYIVFRHNQHQVYDAGELSTKLGFKKFNIKKTGRFFNRKHQLVDYCNVLDNKGNIEYTIEPPSDETYINNAYKTIKITNMKKYTQSTQISCYWMNNNMLMIGADGNVFPCGLLQDRLYGNEARFTVDHHKIKKLMSEVGGDIATNVFHNSIKNIVNGPWFKKIKESWHNENRLERCAIYCGDGINLLRQQNLSIDYTNDAI